MNVGNAKFNAINTLLKGMNQQPLSLADFKAMNPKQVKQYENHLKRMMNSNSKQFKSLARTARKNARTATSEEFKQKQLLHTTIRQGMANASAAATEILGPAGAKSIINAVKQNTDGGIRESGDKDTEKDPGSDIYTDIKGSKPRYSKSSRDEL